MGSIYCCDLLENLYLCGSNNNSAEMLVLSATIVICLKICTFVVATTTNWYACPAGMCCDLLENLYLCGSNNNAGVHTKTVHFVVICLKICTFVVATTTGEGAMLWIGGCDLLENLYLCGSNNNQSEADFDQEPVVICLKICTFVVATTTQGDRVDYRNEL